jgi:hypothetical protein
LAGGITRDWEISQLALSAPLVEGGKEKSLEIVKLSKNVFTIL